MPEVSVVIPVLNNWKLTRGCLRSLARHREGAELEVIVVDNGSDDATAAELPTLGAALFGAAFKVLRNERNRNFGPACNQGAAAASGAYLFFLNNDTLLTPGWLPPLLKALREEQGLGAAAPLLLYPDHTVQHLGVVSFVDGLTHLYRYYPEGHPLTRKKRLVRILTGAALLLPRELFAALGGFYEEYRNGFEDVDLCLRLGALGYKLRCLGEAVIFHLESRSQGRHEHEEHNSDILRQRCTSMLWPDMHIHALEDGFLPALDDYLGLSLLLPEATSQALLRGARAGGKLSPPLLDQVLKANPDWGLGAAMLRRLMEETGDWPLALNYALQEMRQRLSFASLASVIRLAEKAGVEENAVEIGAMLRQLEALYLGEDPEIQRRHANMLSFALKSGDAALARILREKEAEMTANLARLRAQAGEAHGR